MPGRIFISYSEADPQPTRELADFLTARGYSVWWDTNLTAGEMFREVNDRELDAADAVIVIWTAHSVASNRVIAEAERGARRNRLIALRPADLEPWRVPKPYNTYHTVVMSDRDAVLAAVHRLAGEPPKQTARPAPASPGATAPEASALEHWQRIKSNADTADSKKSLPKIIKKIANALIWACFLTLCLVGIITYIKHEALDMGALVFAFLIMFTITLMRNLYRTD